MKIMTCFVQIYFIQFFQNYNNKVLKILTKCFLLRHNILTNIHNISVDRKRWCAIVVSEECGRRRRRRVGAADGAAAATGGRGGRGGGVDGRLDGS